MCVPRRFLLSIPPSAALASLGGVYMLLIAGGLEMAYQTITIPIVQYNSISQNATTKVIGRPEASKQFCRLLAADVII